MTEILLNHHPKLKAFAKGQNGVNKGQIGVGPHSGLYCLVFYIILATLPILLSNNYAISSSTNIIIGPAMSANTKSEIYIYSNLS